MKKFVLLFIVAIACNTFAQQVKEELAAVELTAAEINPGLEQAKPTFEVTIINAFKSGSADKISFYFGENVDLAISEKQNLYSKSQAQQILKNFFAADKPLTFEIIHKGSSGQGQYFIGKLMTESEKEYRVTINSKTINSKQIITSLLIE